MALPEYIRVGLWNYKLTVTDLVITSTATKTPCIAGVDHDSREILLSRAVYEGKELQNAVIHESIHALSYQMGLGLKEMQVDKLANGIETLLLDNPELMAWKAA